VLRADSVVVIAQLREVPAAEGSAEAAQEDEQDLAAAEVGQRDVAVARARKPELGGVAAYGHSRRFDWHDPGLQLQGEGDAPPGGVDRVVVDARVAAARPVHRGSVDRSMLAATL